MTRVLGIDPGLNTAAAIVEPIGGAFMLVSVIDLPTIGEANKRWLDVAALLAWLSELARTCAYIEAAGPRPREGVGSAFRYGRVAGQIEAAIVARAIPLTLVVPAIWKKQFGLDSNKENARLRALQLIPRAASELTRTRDHHRAEALLLACFGAMKGFSA